MICRRFLTMKTGKNFAVCRAVSNNSRKNCGRLKIKFCFVSDSDVFARGKNSLPNIFIRTTLHLSNKNTAFHFHQISSRFIRVRPLPVISLSSLIFTVSAQLKILIRHSYLKNLLQWRAWWFVPAKLAIPNLYRRASGKLQTSSDGQKYEVSEPSLNANYSFKYFGQNKGVSVYSFIDERYLLFYSTVISAKTIEIVGKILNIVKSGNAKETDFSQRNQRRRKTSIGKSLPCDGCLRDEKSADIIGE